MSVDPILAATAQASAAVLELTLRSAGEGGNADPVECLAGALANIINAEPMTEARGQLLGALVRYLEG